VYKLCTVVVIDISRWS